MDINNINPDASYVGYYWMSDATAPEVIAGKDGFSPANLPSVLMKTLENPGANPFVVEAQLFSPSKSLSFGIKYIDGRYVITGHKVEESVQDIKAGVYDNITLKCYVAHPTLARRLLFLQYWKGSNDPKCDGMPVLQPAEMVFIGFESLNTEKEK